jgi:toxin ParE1/3/4
MAYRLTRRARRDVLVIWNYIAEQDEAAADRFVDSLVRKFQFLGQFPHAGRSRDDLAAGYRCFPMGEYLIFYRITKQRISIAHVIHGRRDYTSLLQ